MDLCESLKIKLDRGVLLVGEVRVEKVAGGKVDIRHRLDRGRTDLESFTNPRQARELAKRDSSGVFRPIKSAPSLKRGWQLRLNNPREALEALDYLYPAAIGLWNAWLNGQLYHTHLREFFGRQTGMYRITGRIPDEGAARVVAETCNSETGCLRKILWSLDENRPIDSMPAEKFQIPAEEICSEEGWELPLLCLEPCSLLTAAARREAKRSQ